jgi:hypothetical protein
MLRLAWVCWSYALPQHTRKLVTVVRDAPHTLITVRADSPQLRPLLIIRERCQLFENLDEPGFTITAENFFVAVVVPL